MYLKICGITEEQELHRLKTLPVNLVGLWFGIPDGRANLNAKRWRELAATTASDTPLQAVLVTLLSDASLIVDLLGSTAARWVQLHGYQTPGLIRSIRDGAPDTMIVKVLHLIGDECPESRFIRAYERAGVDLFLIDNALPNGRVGSTGRTVSLAGLAAIVRAIPRPFLLAGGIKVGFSGRYGPILADERCRGIDIDTGARAANGRLDPRKIAAICRDWRALDVGGVA